MLQHPDHAPVEDRYFFGRVEGKNAQANWQNHIIDLLLEGLGQFKEVVLFITYLFQIKHQLLPGALAEVLDRIWDEFVGD